MITVQSPTSVLVDGRNAGEVADAVRNQPLLASDIQRALEVWFEEVSATNAAALKTEQDKVTAKAADLTAAIAVRNAIKEAVRDPGTPTDAAVLEIVAEEERKEALPEKERKVASIDEAIEKLEAEKTRVLAGEAQVSEVVK